MAEPVSPHVLTEGNGRAASASSMPASCCWSGTSTSAFRSRTWPWRPVSRSGLCTTTFVQGTPLRGGIGQVGCHAPVQPRPPSATRLTPREKLTVALHRSVRAFQHQPQLARLIASLEHRRIPLPRRSSRGSTRRRPASTWNCSTAWSRIVHGRSSEPWMPYSIASYVRGPPAVSRSRASMTT